MKEEKLIIHPKRPKGDDGYKTFSVRIREDVVQRIDEISAQTGRSRNELISIFWLLRNISHKLIYFPPNCIGVTVHHNTSNNNTIPAINQA